jgi:hypothetical protein
MTECWAAPLGDCDGKITSEHIFSASVFDGPIVTVEGAPWFKGRTRKIPVGSAVANILCEHHNGRLGEYADPVAKALCGAIQKSVRDKPVNVGSLLMSREATPHVETRSGLVHPRPHETFAGPDFGAWLCKTHCNVQTAAGRVPALTYVRYAFQRRDPGIWFYYPHVVGETVVFEERAHAIYVDFASEPYEPFAIRLCGLWTLVALGPILSGRRTIFINRVREIRFATLTLGLDWTGDSPTGLALGPE